MEDYYGEEVNFPAYYDTVSGEYVNKEALINYALDVINNDLAPVDIMEMFHIREVEEPIGGDE